MPKIELSKIARADLLQVYRFTNQSFGQAQAQIYYDDLWRTFVLLGDFPEIGKRTDWPRKSLRRFVYQAHVIFYRPVSSGVQIIRILSARANFPRQ